MPLIPGFVETTQTMAHIHKSKNDDYATGDNPFSNFDVAEYVANLFDDPRDKVYATMLGIKIARIANLRNKALKGGRPNNESVADSYIDLANYTIIFKCDAVERDKAKTPRPSELVNSR